MKGFNYMHVIIFGLTLGEWVAVLTIFGALITAFHWAIERFKNNVINPVLNKFLDNFKDFQQQTTNELKEINANLKAERTLNKTIHEQTYRDINAIDKRVTHLEKGHERHEDELDELRRGAK